MTTSGTTWARWAVRPTGGAALLLLLFHSGGVGAQGVDAADDGAVRTVTLDEAVKAASRSSPLLQQARANLESMRAQETGTFGRYLPTVSLGYGFSEASTGRLDPTGQTITNRSFSSQLQGSVTVFDGFQRRNDLRSVRAEVDAREATYEQRSFDAALAVKTAFYNAVAARERAAVEEERVARQEEQLRFVREQIRLGQATRSDTLRSRVDLNDARLALLQAGNDERAAEFALAEAMGVEERVRPVAGATLQPDSLRLGLDALLRIAVSGVPSVRSSELGVAAARAGAASARSSYWPSLQVSGGLDWRDDQFPPGSRSWSFGLSGSIPLFNGLQRESGIDRSEAQIELAQGQLRSSELAVRSDVQESYDQIRTALAGLDLAGESVVAAREDLRVTEQRFRAGVATTLDLRSAQIALQQAEVDLIRRQFDVQVGIARLEGVLGASMDELERLAGTEIEIDAMENEE